MVYTSQFQCELEIDLISTYLSPNSSSLSPKSLIFVYLFSFNQVFSYLFVKKKKKSHLLLLGFGKLHNSYQEWLHRKYQDKREELSYWTLLVFFWSGPTKSCHGGHNIRYHSTTDCLKLFMHYFELTHLDLLLTSLEVGQEFYNKSLKNNKYANHQDPKESDLDMLHRPFPMHVKF